MSNGIHQEEAILPGLPRFIAQGILARVPRGSYASMRCVSRAWREALRPSSIFEVRSQELGPDRTEAWLYMTTQLQGPFHAFDPWSNSWRESLPPIPSDHMFTVSDKECFVAGRELFVVGPHLDLDPSRRLRMQAGVFRYSIDSGSWADGCPMLHPRSLFASAGTPRGAAFVAGGVEFGTRIPLRTAELFDRGRWTPLPDMIHARKECSGFFLAGRFFVIGGSDSHDEPLSDGECYDPAARRWSLVRGLWSDPERLQGGSLAPPLVAVVRDELFAWDHPRGLLKRYSFSDSVWEVINAEPPLGRGPNPQSRGWGIGFKGVGDELWLIGGSVPFIDACLPPRRHSGSANWRRVAPTWGAQSFVYNCAVLKA